MKPIAISLCFLLTLGLLCASAALSGTVTDIDGNVYQTVTIGSQEWMAENLKVTHYRNGDSITNVTDGEVWAYLTTGAYGNYDNNAANTTTYGRLYNGYAVADSRKIAPAGWHVPTDTDWQDMISYLGGEAVAGGKMKEPGTTHWQSPNTGANNQSGFFALPGGARASLGYYSGLGFNAEFWSSTETSGNQAWARFLTNENADAYRLQAYKDYGFSVRCVKDVCCTGSTGNVNNTGIVDISDLSSLVSYLTGGGYELICLGESNVNNSGIVDISDLSALVSYLTGGGYVLPSCP